MPALVNPSLIILHHHYHYHQPRRLAAALLPHTLLSLFSSSPRSVRSLPICLYPIPKVRTHTTSSSSTQIHSLPTDNARGGRSGSLASPPVQPDSFEKIDVNPPKGTRDFPPEDMRLRNWLFQNFKEVRPWFQLSSYETVLCTLLKILTQFYCNVYDRCIEVLEQKKELYIR